MAGLVLRRLLAAIPILLITSIGVFLLASLVPGDATTTLAGGENATPERIAEVRHQLHLDDSLPVQYVHWLGNAIHFDFGTSLYSDKPVSSEILNKIVPTLSLALSALVVGLLIGVPLGIISGVRPGSVSDHGARVVSTIGVAIPSFCLAIGLVILLAVRNQILPPQGYVPFSEDPVEFFRYMALPAITLGIGLAASIARQLRGSLIDVLDSNYIRAAWARGARPRLVVAKHALKNAAIPALTVLGLQFGYLLGGTVIIEQIFAIPGLGTLMLQSISVSDLPVIQGLALVFVIGTILMSLVVDIGYGFLNPKVRAPAVADVVVDAEVLQAAPHTARRSVLRRLLTDRQSGWAVVYLTLLGLSAILAPLIAPYGVATQDLDNKYASPSAQHLLGTDDLGRDLLSRMLYGARTSLQASVIVVAAALIIAIPVGLYAGYRRGWVDGTAMRLVDAGMSVPALVLALAIAGVLGPGLNNLMIALVVVFTPGLVRLVRGQALAVSQESFIEASRAAGTSTPRILRHRLLPNVRSVIIIQASFMLGQALLAEAALSYLGLGAQPPNPSWGNMLRRAYDLALFTHPWQLLIPAIAIAITVLAFFSLGDGLRDALGVAGRSDSKPKRNRSLGLTPVSRPAADASRPSPSAAAGALLSVEGLTVEFPSRHGPTARVLDDVTLQIMPGEMLGLVGESGSGKTMTSLSIIRLVPSPGQITAGRVVFDGVDLLGLKFKELRRIRGREIAMIFQDPMTSLNPAFTIGNQLVEAQRLVRSVNRRAGQARATEMLDLVGIPDAARVLDAYPHELSGGMRQRVMIAMALVNGPKLLIADEPTTGLDVTIQAQILALLARLKAELGMAVLFVTHDLGVVAELCDRVVVMYAGQVVENAPVGQLFTQPQHPYSEGLLGAMPRAEQRVERLQVIPGRVPAAHDMPAGCRFHPRCPYVMPECQTAAVPLLPVGSDAEARCLRVTARQSAPAAAPAPVMK